VRRHIPDDVGVGRWVVVGEKGELGKVREDLTQGRDGGGGS